MENPNALNYEIIEYEIVNRRFSPRPPNDSKTKSAMQQQQFQHSRSKHSTSQCSYKNSSNDARNNEYENGHHKPHNHRPNRLSIPSPEEILHAFWPKRRQSMLKKAQSFSEQDELVYTGRIEDLALQKDWVEDLDGGDVDLKTLCYFAGARVP